VWPASMYLVCNYWPFGKDHEEQKIYAKGRACSRCAGDAAWCTDGLCNGGCSAPRAECLCAAVCYNCATLDEATCRCQCAPGSLPRCSTHITLTSAEYPLPGYPGITQYPCYFFTKLRTLYFYATT